MADNHPQIVQSSSPDYICANAVSNCIEFCMESSDLVNDAGSQADGVVNIFAASTQANGLTFNIAGIDFTVDNSSPFTGKTMDWDGTTADIADNMEGMLNANFEFFRNFTYTRFQPAPGSETFFITAREVGFRSDFDFDFSSFVGGTQFGFFNTQGTDFEVKPNYRLLVELYEANPIPFDQQTAEPITTRDYQFNEQDSQLCFDLRTVLQGLVNSSLPDFAQTLTAFYDESAYTQVAIRYGQAYSTDQCTVEPQYQEFSSPFEIINTAIQKNNPIQNLDPYCSISAPNMQFLTNRPIDLAYCNETYLYLPFLLDQALADIADAAAQDVVIGYIVTYKDGSTQTFQGDPLLTPKGTLVPGVYDIPVGVPQLQPFLSSPQPVSSIQVFASLFSLVLPPVVLTDLYTIDYTGQCCRYEIYFLNELGGWDTIQLTDAANLQVDIESLEVVQKENCAGPLYQGGRTQFGKVSTDTLTVVTETTESYRNIEWLKSFINSNSKVLRLFDDSDASELYKVNLLNSSVELRRYNERIIIELQLQLSYDNKIQDNIL